jgi:hypothetical protein
LLINNNKDYCQRMTGQRVVDLLFSFRTTHKSEILPILMLK